MTYPYCPGCGVKFEHKYSQPRLCGQCRYVRESYGCTDERIAELREKYGPGSPLSRIGSTLILDGRHLQTAATMIDELAAGAIAIINELLDGLAECEGKRTHKLAMYELRRGAAINRVARNLPSQFGSPESEDLKPECSERAPAEQPFFVVKDGRIVGEFARDAKMIQDWENWKADGRGWTR